MAAMTSFNIKIPAEWLERLKALAKPAQRTVAGEVRLAVQEHLGHLGVTAEAKVGE